MSGACTSVMQTSYHLHCTESKSQNLNLTKFKLSATLKNKKQKHVQTSAVHGYTVNDGYWIQFVCLTCPRNALFYCTICTYTNTHAHTTYPKATIRNLSMICHLALMPCSQSYLPCSHYTPNSWHHLFPLDVFCCSLRACHFAHAANSKGYVLHTDSPSITVCQDYTAWMCHKAILKNIHDSLFTKWLFGDHRQPWSWGRQKFLSSSMGWSWEIYCMLGDLREKLFSLFPVQNQCWYS